MLVAAATFVLSSLVLKTAQAADADFSNGITVDSNLDTADASIGNGVCDDGGGNCTLRAAIQEANSDPDASEIKFNIAGGGVHTMQPLTPLPSLTERVTINGYSQPGSSVNTAASPLPMNGTLAIELDGSNLAINIANRGLNIAANNSEVKGLIINNFGDSGIVVSADSVVIQGNYIGTDSTGLVDQGNGRDYVVSSVGDGVFNASGSDGTVIGGTTPAARNVIAGNQSNNIFLGPDNGTSNDRVKIQGNYIGVGANGTTPLPSGYALGLGNAILMENSHYTLIGGTETGASNVIGSASEYGVAFREGVTNTVVQGNMIGTDYTGTQLMTHSRGTGNAQAGVHVGIVSNAGFTLKCHDILIGGTTVAARNIISGNNSEDSSYIGGVSINDGSYNVTVQGNYIGTDVTGTLSIPNGTGVLMDTSDNAQVQEAYDNVIGGDSANERNIISGNNGSGVYLNGPGLTTNSFQGNYIGLGADGSTSVPNGEDGVRILDGPQNNTFGGTGAGEGNVITASAGNGSSVGAGIITFGSSSSNSFLGNSIYSNAGLGVDLAPAGFTANDTNDADSGPNGLLNFPSNLTYYEAGGNTVTDYQLDVPAGNYRVEFFSSPTADPSGYGEGKVYLGYQDITSNGSGSQNFSHVLSGTSHTNITATTTLKDGSADGFGPTSEFSAVAEEVAGPADLALTKTLLNPQSIVAGGNASYQITLTNNGPTAVDLTMLNGTNINPFAGFLFIDFLPSQLTYTGNTNSDITCTNLGTTLSSAVAGQHADYNAIACAYNQGSGSLASGESIVDTLNVSISNDAELKFVNYALAPAIDVDPDSGAIMTAVITAFGGGGSPDLIDAMVSLEPNNFAVASIPPSESGGQDSGNASQVLAATGANEFFWYAIGGVLLLWSIRSYYMSSHRKATQKVK